MPTFDKIQAVTLTGTASSVTFSSIPQTYTDLVLRFSVRTTSTAANVAVRINGLTTTIYSQTNLTGDGSAAASARQSSQTSVSLDNYGTQSGNTSNTFSSAEIYLPAYIANANKPFAAVGVQESNAASPVYCTTNAALVRTTAAITEIALLQLNSDTFVAGSSFYLYGIQ